MSEIVTLQLRISCINGRAYFQFAMAFPLHYKLTQGRDYLHEVVSIQGPTHVVDVGSSPLISRSHYKYVGMTLHQTCQWEHALR